MEAVERLLAHQTKELAGPPNATPGREVVACWPVMEDARIDLWSGYLDFARRTVGAQASTNEGRIARGNSQSRAADRRRVTSTRSFVRRVEAHE